MKRDYLHTIIVVLLCIMVSCIWLTACKRQPEEEQAGALQDSNELIQEAAVTPFGKYPELVTYTLGKMTGTNRSNMPIGDTYEDNLYTRYLRNVLNIQNINVFEEAGDHYDNVVTMAISERSIPDIMIVSNQNVLKSLVDNGMIEDLTQIYENCASDKIKEMYDSYGGRAFDTVTFNGKIMAIPGVNIEYGPNLLWLRKDWMDKLGLEEPKSLHDVEMIVREFVEKDPNNNGEGNTIGMACGLELTGNYDLEYQMDVVFAAHGALPKKWIRQDDGTLVYGSVTEEAKEALRYLQRWYEEGILDNLFLMRSTDNIHDQIINGHCGAFFGPWWAPNNPLMQSYAKYSHAEWVPYLIPTEEGGSCMTYRQAASNKYVVVRKGYEHPEIAVKIISVLFDYERFIDKSTPEIGKIYDTNLDPTARPIVINVDYNDAYFRSCDAIQQVLNEEADGEELTTLEKSYYELCKSYLAKEDVNENASPEEWAAYTSRITAADLLRRNRIRYVENEFEGQTETMQSKWWSLQQLENDAYLKIITGVEPIDYFDSFVEQWREQGGQLVEKEVNLYVGVGG